MTTLLLVKCDLGFNDIFIFLLYLRGVITVVSLALEFFKSFFVRSFFFCSLKSFLNGASSGNIYYLYDEVIVSIFVENILLQIFIRIIQPSGRVSSNFGRIYLFSNRLERFLHFFCECVSFYPAIGNGFFVIRSDLTIKLDVFSPVVWGIFFTFSMSIFLEFFVQDLRWCQF